MLLFHLSLLARPSSVPDSPLPLPLAPRTEMYDIVAESDLVILLMCGTFNPIHLMHLRMFYLAKQNLEMQGQCHVLGGVLAPHHDSTVRSEIRGAPSEVIPARHRVAMARRAVEGNSWLGVDAWAASRKTQPSYPAVLRRTGLDP